MRVRVYNIRPLFSDDFGCKCESCKSEEQPIPKYNPEFKISAMGWEEIAKHLGKDIGENFQITDCGDCVFRFTENGLVDQNGNICEYVCGALLNGGISIKKKQFKPIYKEFYWYWDVNDQSAQTHDYSGDMFDKIMIKHKFAKSTYEEAVASRKRVEAFFAEETEEKETGR